MTALTDMGYPEKFAPSALRLANNSLDQAAVLVQKMTARAAELEKGDVMTSSVSTPTSTAHTSSVSYAATGQAVLTNHQKLNKTIDTSFEADTLLSDTVTPVFSPRSESEKVQIAIFMPVIRLFSCQ